MPFHFHASFQKPFLILAPMSGVTDLPFRRCVREQGGCSLVISEMVASAAMVHENEKTLRRSAKASDEYPFGVQLVGCEPILLGQAAKMAQDGGATLIDLNFGCPARKIAINSYGGAALMRDENLAEKVFEAVLRAVSIPVTVKMRKGWDESNQNALSLVKIAEKAGLSWTTIHGRTRCQFYQGQADWDFIGKIREKVQMPIIANGDIKTEEDVKKVLETVQGFGAMIGRGAYGKPWIFSQMAYFLKTGEKKPSPSIPKKREIILKHFDDTLSHYGAQAGARIFRKHLGWYSKGLDNGSAFRSFVFQETEYKKITQSINAFFQ